MAHNAELNIADSIDNLMKTFKADRAYCGYVLASSSRNDIAAILVYWKWARQFFPHFQEALSKATSLHFPESNREEAHLWTQVLVGSILKELGLIPYLLLRGLTPEAGHVLRRCLEHLGVFTHLWAEPLSAEALVDAQSSKYKSAFVREPDKQKARTLKAKGIAKRFASLGSMASTATQLYKILSGFHTHGGTTTHLFTSPVEPTAFSCAFLNRSEETGHTGLRLIGMGYRVVCIESVTLFSDRVKQYRTHPRSIIAGGKMLLELICDGPTTSPRMRDEIARLFDRLGIAIQVQ